MMTNSSELSFLGHTVCENLNINMVMIWSQTFFSLKFYKEIIGKLPLNGHFNIIPL